MQVLDRYKISELEKKVLEVAPEVVAMKLAESDNKRLKAAEAVEEEKRMHKLAEESQAMLQLCLEIDQQCNLKKPTWHGTSIHHHHHDHDHHCLLLYFLQVLLGKRLFYGKELFTSRHARHDRKPSIYI